MKINHDHPLRDNGFSNTKTNFDHSRHRWYYFKEGFSPGLVDFALEKTDFDKSKDIVLDPFNGSGTVTLCSTKQGVRSIGVETNPFAAFLAKSKVLSVDVNDLEKQVYGICRSLKKLQTSPLIEFSTFSDNGINEKWLFNRDVLNTFHTAHELNRECRQHNTRRLVQLGLIGSAMENCNAVRDGKCLRYKSNWQLLKYDQETFLASFQSKMKLISEDIRRDRLKTRLVKIHHNDSRVFLKDPQLPKFKLCITSPPYLNSFDYSDVYRPELYIGGFLKTRQELLQLRKETIRSHAFVKKEELKKANFGLLYDQAINGINEDQGSSWKRKIPVMIQGYFQDMQTVLGALKNKAVNGAQLWIIVSNSAYNDVEIPVDLILADIGTKLGWNLVEIGVLRQVHKRGSKYSPEIKSLRESVIIFQRGNR